MSLRGFKYLTLRLCFIYFPKCEMSLGPRGPKFSKCITGLELNLKRPNAVTSHGGKICFQVPRNTTNIPICWGILKKNLRLQYQTVSTHFHCMCTVQNIADNAD